MNNKMSRSNYGKLLNLYKSLQKDTIDFDNRMKKLKKEFRNVLDDIKISKNRSSLKKLYKQGMVLAKEISELASKHSILTRDKFIAVHFKKFREQRDQHELNMLKHKLMNPPVKFKKMYNHLIRALDTCFQNQAEKLFYNQIISHTPVEIVMDNDIAIISGRTVETMPSAYVITKLSKLSNKKITVTDVPLYATVHKDKHYITLTLVERRAANDGITANRKFIRIPRNTVKL